MVPHQTRSLMRKETKPGDSALLVVGGSMGVGQLRTGDEASRRWGQKQADKTRHKAKITDRGKQDDLLSSDSFSPMCSPFSDQHSSLLIVFTSNSLWPLRLPTARSGSSFFSFSGNKKLHLPLADPSSALWEATNAPPLSLVPSLPAPNGGGWYRDYMHNFLNHNP